MANNAPSFKALQCKKAPGGDGAAAQKVGCGEFAQSAAGAPYRVRKTLLKTRLCSRIAKSVATNSTNFASLWRLWEQNSVQDFLKANDFL
jgi:hypothetical protein